MCIIFVEQSTISVIQKGSWAKKAFVWVCKGSHTKLAQSAFCISLTARPNIIIIYYDTIGTVGNWYHYGMFRKPWWGRGGSTPSAKTDSKISVKILHLTFLIRMMYVWEKKKKNSRLFVRNCKILSYFLQFFYMLPNSSYMDQIGWNVNWNCAVG